MPLQNLIERASRTGGVWASDSEEYAQPMAGLKLFRQQTPTTKQASFYEPVLCLILQGRKQVAWGPGTVSFGSGECLLVSHQLPVESKITKAPYLSLVFEVDVVTIRGLYEEVTEVALADESGRAVVTHRADAGLLDAFDRYLALIDAPADAKVLGPLIRKEIHYRLLTASFGGMLRSLIRHDSSASTIARAIGFIRSDIRAPIVIPELARRCGMSASSFYKHFKEVTSTTPLQYQKEVRLLEARARLRAGASVSSTAYDVGYESPSQFSREYARKFGVAPSRELEAAEPATQAV